VTRGEKAAVISGALIGFALVVTVNAWSVMLIDAIDAVERRFLAQNGRHARR